MQNKSNGGKGNAGRGGKTRSSNFASKPKTNKTDFKPFGAKKSSSFEKPDGTKGKTFGKNGFDKQPFSKKKEFGTDKFADSPRKPSSRSSFKDDFDKKPFNKKKSFDTDKFADSPRKPSSRSSFNDDFDKKPFSKKKSFDTDKFADSPRKPSSRSTAKEGFDKKPYGKKGSFVAEKRTFGSKNNKSYSKDGFDKKPSAKKYDDKPILAKKGKKVDEEFEEIVRNYQAKPDNITTKEKFKKKGFSEDAKSSNNRTPAEKTTFKSNRKKQIVEEKNKHVNKKTAEEDLNSGEIRLNRFIANAGICSRREADTLISAGLVTINGKAVTEMGYKIKAGDDIRYNGQRLSVEAKIYILMNKPKDAITTASDPEGRNTVFDLIEGKLAQRVFAVGRLDRNTTGVLLSTNDGDLAQRLTHPKFEVEKVYVATLNKPFTKADMWQLASGIELEDGPIAPDALAYSEEERKDIIGVEIHSGRNRIIHRMFEHMGYLVDKLDRVAYAGLTKSKLKRGEWRELTDKELKMVKKIAKMG
jgi:23S rRNA pseudouridine2605 synthase